MLKGTMFSDDYVQHKELGLDFVQIWSTDVAQMAAEMRSAISYDLKIVVAFRESLFTLDKLVYLISKYADLRTHIIAIYPFDEPYINGMSFLEFERYCRLIKTVLPEMKIITTFGMFHNQPYQIPIDVDYVGITPRYGRGFYPYMPDYELERLVKRAEIMLYPHQRWFLCMDGGMVGDNKNYWLWDYQKVSFAKHWMKWAEDHNAYAVWWWLWKSLPGFTGVEDYPRLQEFIKNY